MGDLSIASLIEIAVYVHAGLYNLNKRYLQVLLKVIIVLAGVIYVQ